jgi:ribosomal protein S18 acetylase RimI-like enzyme
MLLLAPRRSRALALAALVATAGASSCATYSDKTEEARRALRRADYEESIEQWNEILKVRSAQKLPDKWKKNYGLVILERATVLQAMRDYELSSRDFQVADKELELLDIARDGAGKLGKYIY